jgi:ribonuclease PH
VPGRVAAERTRLRPVTIELGVMKYAEGSALIKQGDTQVLVSASIEDRVPPFAKEAGHGWITAEYAMLPRATRTRKARESSLGKVGGRTQEIQRLVGRALRSVTDLSALGERMVWIDCDVLQADGGTRTASITAGFVALAQALAGLAKQGLVPGLPLGDFVAAVSVGLVGDLPVLDLCYEEDAGARVDMNVVMTADGKVVEIQGTGEQAPFTVAEMETLVGLARGGIAQLIEVQRAALGPLAAMIGGSSHWVAGPGGADGTGGVALDDARWRPEA